jgi:3'-5' exoribonuclease
LSMISELKVGSVDKIVALIKTVTPGLSNGARPSEYLDLMVRDQEGSEIFVKFWSVTLEQKRLLEPLTLVEIHGKVGTFKGSKQIVASGAQLAYPPEGLDLTDFVKRAPVDSTILVESIFTAAAKISDYYIRNVVNYCLKKIGKALIDAPAAKENHHNYYGGLAYHITRMLQIADFICKQRPIIDRDLLFGGMILHDIAKPEEMRHQLGITQEYTFKGKLIGHIVLVYGWTIEAALHYGYDLEDQRLTLLQHMILSHHNLGAWGSPTQPQLIEAVALHYIDQLDAKLQMAEDELEKVTSEEGWTERIFALENKELFKHISTLKS